MYKSINMFSNEINVKNEHIENDLLNARNIKEETKRLAIKNFFFKSVNNSLNGIAQKGLSKIINDMINSNTKINNFDNTNKIWIGDLLYLFSQQTNCNRSIIVSLQTQLEYIAKNKCKQSNCKKIYEILSLHQLVVEKQVVKKQIKPQVVEKQTINVKPQDLTQQKQTINVKPQLDVKPQVVEEFVFNDNEDDNKGENDTEEILDSDDSEIIELEM